MESIESKTPPLPGIILPLSLHPAERLNADSTKSPIIPEVAIKTPIRHPFQRSP